MPKAAQAPPGGSSGFARDFVAEPLTPYTRDPRRRSSSGFSTVIVPRACLM